MENTENKNKIFKYLLVVFFAVFVGTGIFLMTSSKTKPEVVDSIKTEEESETTIKRDNLVIPTLTPKETSQTIVSESTTNSYKVGDQVIFYLTAETGEKNIVGYDTVLYFDPLAFDFVKAESLQTDYRIYDYKRDNYLTLTALKDLQSPASPLNQARLVRLVFQAKQKGRYNFSLLPEYDKVKTDFVTENTEVLSPALNELTVEVK
ncbi:MAG: hypothetical protein US40_C0004G0022 [Candidatus Roizmanbacteria bacterium GW2011_GWC2_37_13]|uniref:Cohesin domain-containing protein n=1 Tax=Candidatus Roizmanbacteria bacterium GW2011_GWC2_37_13 TaxID=1618486 RepID=A0A0G0G7G6_9BACT|nr:MAG: hypothetical protein US38_C0001G0009 [Candidatus Roizmanbacteria bacterium GW2011_GWC1_37_12]KKQ25987.1 MAG: hypothetical protein US40_C0004G0022 [Candidatus Roizmanbacteria bacterium GW2011_GWC2_37_13]